MLWSVTRNPIFCFITFVLLLDLSLFATSSYASPLGRIQDDYNRGRGTRTRRPSTTRGPPNTTSASSSPPSSTVTQDAVSSSTTSSNPTTTPTGNTALATATLPSNGGGLPPPSSGLTLKAVVIGSGTQNYTCSAGNSSSAPTTNGAHAQLFDGSSLLSSQDDLNARTADSLTNPPSLPEIGVHYFNGARVPTFDLLDSTGLLFMGGKLAGVPAPSDANPGLSQEGAVDWLKLGDKGQSVGVKEVYRVETAGGKAPVSCTDQVGDVTVKYATQYWFYG